MHVTRLSAVTAALLLSGCGAGLRAAEARPVSVQTAPGRFEISALDSTAAHVVASAAEEAWRILGVPLGLPDAFPSPVYVHVAAEATPGTAPFHSTVEPGGIVSVRLVVNGVGLPTVRRAVVQGLLLRLAIAQHGVNERLTVPLWLELGAVGLWETRADAAQLDALKWESRNMVPPRLDALLAWSRGAEERRSFVNAATWLLAFLQNESGRAREWPALLKRVLAGEDQLAAVALCYPERFGNAEQRELWWQTGFHHLRRARSLPVLEVTDSYTQLGALARFVFSSPDGEFDAVVPLAEVLGRHVDPIVAAEVARRATELERLVPALHPFYRNAGLALAEAFRAPVKNPARLAALCAAFDQDWRDAVELTAASTATLDAMEQRR